MALWKETGAAPQRDQKETAPLGPTTQDAAAKADLGFAAELGATARKSAPRESNESVIGGGVTIVGKIDGAGSVRLGGRFEGDVDIQGDLTIEAGAKLTGTLRARSITIAGEIEGNVERAERVELLPSAMVSGDITARTLIVASGAKVRGRSNVGWDEGTNAKAPLTLDNRQAS